MITRNIEFPYVDDVRTQRDVRSGVPAIATAEKSAHPVPDSRASAEKTGRSVQ